jgi:hypothetical protein
MQNTSVSMTKDQYYEMCEALGTEPIESEVPVEIEDFPVEVQQAFSVYRMLRDEWDSMNGLYLGKSLVGVTEILSASEIDPDDSKFIIMLVRSIDQVRAQEINNKKSNTKPAST